MKNKPTLAATIITCNEKNNKRGFLDGTQGWIIAVSSAYSTFLREAKLYELDCLGLDILPPHYQ